MKRILIIPSWYPTQESPYSGIFFKVQTELMHPQYDMRILAGNPHYYGKKTFVNFLLSPKVQYLKDYFIPTNGLIPFQYKQLTLKSFKSNLTASAKAYFKALNTYITENNWMPDVIHAHDTFWAGYYAKYISEKMKIPFVLTHHNPLIFTNYTPIQESLLKETIEAANKLLCVSNFDKRTFLISGYNVNPIFVGNFVDDSKFTLKNDCTNRDIFNLFTVGLASKRKDFPNLLKALHVLIYKYEQRDIILTLSIPEKFSDGISMSELKALTFELKINDYCRFVSNLSLHDLVHEYQKADLFVSSSYFETFGVAVCEAMSCGTPVVAVNNGGIDDIINYNNGIRIDIGDYENMAEAILKVKNKTIVFDKNRVRESIVEKFGRKAFFDKISSIYNSFS